MTPLHMLFNFYRPSPLSSSAGDATIPFNLSLSLIVRVLDSLRRGTLKLGERYLPSSQGT